MKATGLVLIFFCLLNGTAFGQYERLVKIKTPGITTDTLYKKVKNDLEFLKLSPRDTILDIGSYDGYYPALYSLFTDSLVFYLNEVNPEYFTAFDSIRYYCESITGKKMQGQFYFTIGNDTSTGILAAQFKKVIVRDAFHHFEQKETMLAHIKRITRPGATLYLFEQVVPGVGENKTLCAGAMTKEKLMQLLSQKGFELKRSLKGKNDHWWFEFSRK